MPLPERFVWWPCIDSVNEEMATELPELSRQRNAPTGSMITQLQKLFSANGLPESVPRNLRHFLKLKSVKHVLCRP